MLERAARSAAAPLFFAFAFAARMQWSGRGHAERRGARQEQSSNDEAMSTCLGQTWQCDVRERPARRAAAPPLLLFWLRGAQWSGRCRVERRGTRREQRESDGVQYVVVATRAMRVWRPPATRDASALGANVEDQRFAGVVMDVP